MKQLLFLFIALPAWPCSFYPPRGVATVPPTGARLPRQPQVWVFVHGQPQASYWLEGARERTEGLRFVLRPLAGGAEVELTARPGQPVALASPRALEPGPYALEVDVRRAPDCVQLKVPPPPASLPEGTPMCAPEAVAHRLWRWGSERADREIICCPGERGPLYHEVTDRVLLATWLVDDVPGEAPGWAGFGEPGRLVDCGKPCDFDGPEWVLPLRPVTGGARTDIGATLFAVWLGPGAQDRPPDRYVPAGDALVLNAASLCPEPGCGEGPIEVTAQALDPGGHGTARFHQVLTPGPSVCPRD